MSDETGIGTYPVGVLRCLLQAHRFVVTPALWRVQEARQIVFNSCRHEIRYLHSRAQEGDWRSIKSAFNGFLAEWNYPPNDSRFRHAGRCGSGWTRKRALRSLGQQIVAANLSTQETQR